MNDTYILQVYRDGGWHIVGQYASRRQAQLIADDYRAHGERTRIVTE